jgi:serine/threonine protein kinase
MSLRLSSVKSESWLTGDVPVLFRSLAILPCNSDIALPDLYRQLRQVAPPSFFRQTGVVIILGGIVMGTTLIHVQRYRHQDLKPENILIDEHGFAHVNALGTTRLIHLAVTLTHYPATLQRPRISMKKRSKRRRLMLTRSRLYLSFSSRSYFRRITL